MRLLSIRCYPRYFEDATVSKVNEYENIEDENGATLFSGTLDSGQTWLSRRRTNENAAPKGGVLISRLGIIEKRRISKDLFGLDPRAPTN